MRKYTIRTEQPSCNAASNKPPSTQEILEYLRGLGVSPSWIQNWRPGSQSFLNVLIEKHFGHQTLINNQENCTDEIKKPEETAESHEPDKLNDSNDLQDNDDQKTCQGLEAPSPSANDDLWLNDINNELLQVGYCNRGVEVGLDEQGMLEVLRDCTQETQESQEIKETNEIHHSRLLRVTGTYNKDDEIKDCSSEIWTELTNLIGKCRVSLRRKADIQLFQLARRIRGIEKRSDQPVSIELLAKVTHHWVENNKAKLITGHDYLAELLDKLSLVRHPAGAKTSRSLTIC